MKTHLILSCKFPMNWHSIIKILNAHKPDFVSFCHYDDDISTLDLEMPDEIQNYFPQLDSEHINMKLGERFSIHNNYQKKIDVRIGATFSQIMITEMADNDLWRYCSSFDGKKLVRLDNSDVFDIEPIEPLKVLELSGKSFSMTKVSKQPFLFEEFLPQIIAKNRYHRYLNSTRLKELGDFCSQSKKVKLTDSKGNSLLVDSRSRHGFWLEDIVMRKLSIMWSKESQVFTNVTRNYESESKQIKLGLKRVLKKLQSAIPAVKDSIIQYFSLENETPSNEIIENIITELDSEIFKKNITIDVFEVIYRTGAKNEFDGIIVNSDGIKTVEIKSTEPKIEQVIKLETFSKYLSPIKGNNLYLICNYNDEYGEIYKDLNEQIKKDRRGVIIINFEFFFGDLLKPNR